LAFWAIVFFGKFIENFRSSANSWANFFRSASYVLILTKNWLGYILGNFLQTHLVTLLLANICLLTCAILAFSFSIVQSLLAGQEVEHLEHALELI
jgi:hypothetical protein